MSVASLIRRRDLFDQLVANPAGITVEDMMAEHGWTLPQTNNAIRDLRHFLGDHDSINLPCVPQGKGERWVYRLVGNLDGVRGWTMNRVKDADSRIRTMQKVLLSIVSATSGRTTEGRRARTMEKALRRLVEDLDDLMLDGATP